MSREAFEAWARDNRITFVSRSSGEYTTDTISRDALRNLWQSARAAALEEAARKAENYCGAWDDEGYALAMEILALKERE